MAKARITPKTKKSAAKAKPAAKKSKRGAAKREVPAFNPHSVEHDDVVNGEFSPPTDSYLLAPSAAESLNPNDIDQHANLSFALTWRSAGNAATAPLLLAGQDIAEATALFKRAWDTAVPVMLSLGGEAALDAAEAWLDLARTALGDTDAGVFMKQFKALVATQAREAAKQQREDERERKQLDKMPPMSPQRTAAVRKMIQRHQNRQAGEYADVGAYLANVEASYAAWVKENEQRIDDLAPTDAIAPSAEAAPAEDGEAGAAVGAT